MLPLLKVETSVKFGAEKPGATDTSVRGLLTTRRSKASLGRKTCRAVGSGQWAVWLLCQIERCWQGERVCHPELSLGRTKTCRAMGGVADLPSWLSAARQHLPAYRAVAGQENLWAAVGAVPRWKRDSRESGQAHEALAGQGDLHGRGTDRHRERGF